MNVDVLPYAWATLCTTYFRICTSSAFCTSVVELDADLALAGGRDLVMMHLDADRPMSSSARHIDERMSCVESTGGTGK